MGTTNTIIGIDLGTTTCEVAYLENGKPVRLREIGNAPHGFLPSVVGFGPDGGLCVGSAAEQLLVPFPDRAVAEVKRQMGHDTKIVLAGEALSPQEVSAILLRHLKREAERALGTSVSEAIITVPANFTNAQRQATLDAGELAGLQVRRLLNEPTAAALAYGLKRPGVEEIILVYDLGGGTFDVTLLELSEGILEVLATTGNPRLGGQDFDRKLMQFLQQECMKATGVDLMSGRTQEQRLKAAARRAKEELSASDRTIVTIDNLGTQPDGTPIHFTQALTRAAFEAQIDALVTSTASQLDEVLRSKGLRPHDVSTILMVGGSTRVPLVRQFVSSYFGNRPLRTEVDPEEAVAWGAGIMGAMQGRELDPHTLLITDVTSHTLGVSIVRDKDGQSMSGMFDPIILKQSTIPRTERRTYQTARDLQDAIHVEVYQGDAERAADNEPVGDFVLGGLPPSPAGVPVEIEFTYNLNGLLEVVARVPQWQLERRVTMQPSARHLTEQQKVSARQRLEHLHAKPIQPGSAKAHATGSDHQQQTNWRTARQYSRVAALLAHADRRLPTVNDAAAEQIAGLVRSIRSALEHDDDASIDQHERSLTDLLFGLS